MYWNPQSIEEEPSEPKEIESPILKPEEQIESAVAAHSPFERTQFLYHYDGEWKDDMMKGQGNLYIRRSSKTSAPEN